MRVLFILALTLTTACSSKQSTTEATTNHKAEAFDDAECAACGMVVREQPSPRAQLVHRDGHRAHFCSMGDLLTYHKAPSSHGKPAAVFVEVMPPEAKASIHDRAALPWAKAANASYVVGFSRPGIMGAPVLVFADTKAAKTAAIRERGRMVDWAGLRELAR